MDREDELCANFPLNFFCGLRTRRIAWFQPVHWERDNQMSESSEGDGRRPWPMATVSGHLWPVYGSNRLHATYSGSPRDMSR